MCRRLTGTCDYAGGRALPGIDLGLRFWAGESFSYGTVYPPPPSFTFEDLGLSLKVTATVRNLDTVALDIVAGLKSFVGKVAATAGGLMTVLVRPAWLGSKTTKPEAGRAFG